MSISKEVIPIHVQIKEARTAAGLTITELADKIGITRDAMNKIETGANDPLLKTLRKISKATNCNFCVTK